MTTSGRTVRWPASPASFCTLLIVLLAVTTTVTRAQSDGVLSGTVRTGDGAVVVDADVTVRGLKLVARTDTAGTFAIAGVPAGVHFVVVRGIGIEANETRVLVRYGQRTRVDITIVRSATKLGEVLVSAGRESYRERASSSVARGGLELMKSPASVSIVNASRMRDQGANRVDEMFAYMSGISMQGTRGQSFVLRGFSLDQEFSTFLIDGINGSIYRQHDPPGALIDRIEYLKGPASIVFGVGQPGGAINIITKRPSGRASQSIDVRHDSYASELSVLGDRNGFAVTTDFTGPVTESNDLLYRVILSHIRGESYRDEVSDGSLLVAPSLSWHASGSTDASLALEISSDHGSFDEYVVAPRNDIDAAPVITRRLGEPTDSYREFGVAASAAVDHRFSEAIELHVQARHADRSDGRRLFQHRTIINDSVLARSYRDQENDRRWTFGDAYMTARFATGELDHTLVAGASGGYEAVQFNRVSLTADTSLNINIYDPVYNARVPKAKPGTNRFWNNTFASAYLEDRVSLGDLALIMAGARFDVASIDHEEKSKSLVFSKTDAALSPRLALVVTPVSSLSAYFSYGMSFAPTDAERENAEGTIDFDPERGEQFEAGVRADVLDGMVSASVAAYQITQRNTLCQVEGKNPNGNAIYRQVGSTRSRGGEIEIHAAPIAGLQLAATAAYTDARIGEDGAALYETRVPHVPHTTASLWSTYRIATGTLGGFGVGAGAVYTGDRPSALASGTTPALVLPEYTRFDGSIFYETGSIRAAVNVMNIFDTRYWSSGDALHLVPGAPRSVRTSVTITR